MELERIKSALELHHMTSLGERGEITLEISRKILEGAL